MRRLLNTTAPVVIWLAVSVVAPGQETRVQPGIRKPTIDDTIRATVYADNAFQLFMNGELLAVDSITFVPHNVVEVDILPAYPMTIAVMAVDNADPTTGMEYANTSIGDGGFILKLGDGTVTDALWKAKRIAWGPVEGDTQNPRVERVPLPDGWSDEGFDDSEWPHATEYSQATVDPKGPYYEHDFEGARFIWSDDLKLDNVVLFRTVVHTPPDGKVRPDFRGLSDTIPESPRRGRGGDKGPRRSQQSQSEGKR